MAREVFKPRLSELLPYRRNAEALTWLPDYLADAVGDNCIDMSHEAIAGKLILEDLIDYSFGSDEVAAISLLSFDGAPMAVAEKYGDRGRWDLKVIDGDAWRCFRHAALDAQIASELEDVHDIANIEARSDQSYIRYTRDAGDALSVHILCPRWSQFSHHFKTQQAHIDGEPVEFISWTNPEMKSWEGGDAEKVRVRFTASGEVRDVNGVEIGFRPPRAEPAPGIDEMRP